MDMPIRQRPTEGQLALARKVAAGTKNERLRAAALGQNGLGSGSIEEVTLGTLELEQVEKTLA